MTVLRVEGLALGEKGASLDLTLEEGESLAVMGPPGAGKSALLALLAQTALPLHGRVVWAEEVRPPVRSDPLGSARATPSRLASRAAGRDRPEAVAEALVAAGLWDARRSPLSELGQGQRQACALLPVLAAPSRAWLFDGTLDPLDPWRLDAAFALAEARGATLVAATGRVDVAERCSHLVVLDRRAPLFAGRTEDLVWRVEPVTVEVETDSRDTARTIAEPFALTIEVTEQGLRFTSARGQEAVAALLTRGYGSVRATCVARPSLSEALRHLRVG